MSSRKRSRADDHGDEDDEEGSRSHASSNKKRAIIDGATDTMRPSNGAAAVAAAPFTGVVSAKAKKLTAAERLKLARTSMAANPSQDDAATAAPVPAAAATTTHSTNKTSPYRAPPRPSPQANVGKAVPAAAAAAAAAASAAAAAPAAARGTSPYRAPPRPSTHLAAATTTTAASSSSSPAPLMKPYVHDPKKVVAAPARAAAVTSPPRKAAGALSTRRSPPTKQAPPPPVATVRVPQRQQPPAPAVAVVQRPPAPVVAAPVVVQRPTVVAPVAPVILQRPPVASVAAPVRVQKPEPWAAPTPVVTSVHHDGQLRNEGGDVFYVEAPKAGALVVGPATVRKMLRIAAVFLIGGAVMWTAQRLANPVQSWIATIDLASYAPSAIGGGLTLVDPQHPPCFESSPDGAVGQLADRCAEPDTHFLPCPTHAVCEAGQVVACDNGRLWVLHTPEPWTVPTSCVPSSEALAAIALVTKRLEAWSWPATCEGNPDVLKPPEARKGGGATVAPDRVMFPYSDVVASLEDPFLAAIEPGQFAELARTRLSVLWDKDDASNGGSGGLWLGLLPGHTRHLPASCRAANAIVTVARTVGSVAWNAVLVGVLLPAYDSMRFVLKVALVIFRTYPLGLTVASIWVVAAALYWRKKSQQHADREAFRYDVDLTLGAAVDVLKREEEPLRCLALRDDLREHLEGQLRGDSHHFNRRVWPEVQSILESDQRVALRLVRGDQAFLWVGPTASS